MRTSISSRNHRILARSAAILLLGGVTAGCSSGAMRFSDVTDGLFTGSTANQRAIIHDQPYPGDQQTASAAPVQPVPSAGGVSRSSLPPVGSAPAPKAVAAAPLEQQPAASPSRATPALDQTTTGTVASAAPVPASHETIKGWSRAGGTQITAKDGETVYNLSRRFGVPADVLMKMNGLTPENGLKVGQKVVIPTYVYSAKAGVSAPDNDSRTAQAKSSRGVKEKTPAESQQLVEQAAVLPPTPKVKPGEKLGAAGGEGRGAGGGTYTVVAGDTLSKISRHTGISVAALKQANGLSDGTIRIGQVLKLGADASVAQAKPAEATKAPELDTTSTASVEPSEKKPETGKLAGYTPPKTGKAVEQVASSATEAEAPDSTGIDRMRWPVRGKVVSGFGSSGGAKNDGIDISVPKGTPVKAAENGVVIYAGDGLKEFGNTVLVRHDDGIVTVYGHASEIKVQRGQKVKRGEEIAVSGMSGNAKTPRLHFEVRKNSAPVDPKTFLE